VVLLNKDAVINNYFTQLKKMCFANSIIYSYIPVVDETCYGKHDTLLQSLCILHSWEVRLDIQRQDTDLASYIQSLLCHTR